MKRVIIFYFLLSVLTIQPLFAQENVTEPPLTPANVLLTEPIIEQETVKPLETATASPEAPRQSPLPSLDVDIVSATPAATNSPLSTTQTELEESLDSSASGIEQNLSTSSAVHHDINNQATTTTSAHQVSTTGDNHVDTVEKAAVNTGSASAVTTVKNELNTTTIGQNYHYGSDIVTANHGPLDLSAIEKKCETSPTSVASTSAINITNDASMTNDFELTASSGTNELQGAENTLTTGDASATAQVANIANTSLIGDCWLFHSITIFSPYTYSIILPNEEQFIKGAQLGGDHPASSSTTINNAATINEEVRAQTNTGNNITDGGTTVTGDSIQHTETVTQANTTLLGDAWLLLKIINPQYWKGSLLNGYVPSYQDSNAMYFWLPSSYLSGGSTAVATELLHSALDITINNTATVENSLSLNANTGDNISTGGKSTVNTGNASTEAELFNLLNTTVIGNNWYFVLLTLFDDFTGDISFARPDLSLISAPSFSAPPGATVNFNLGVVNQGNSTARDIQISQAIPDVNTSAANNTSTWQVEELTPNSSATLPLSLSLPSNLSEGKYFVTYTVTSPYNEDKLENNSFTLVLNVQPTHSVETQATTAILPRTTQVQRTLRQVPRTQLRRVNPLISTPSTQNMPQVLGVQYNGDAVPKLSVALPSGFAGPFCVKHWDLCSAAGILLTTMPLKALERKKIFFNKTTEL